jgi:hypothetical protein
MNKNKSVLSTTAVISKPAANKEIKRIEEYFGDNSPEATGRCLF